MPFLGNPYLAGNFYLGGDRSSGGGEEPPPPTGDMSAVTRDATSLKYVPNTAAEWTSTMTAASLVTGNPSLLYRCQETSGALAESITGVITLAATATPTYNQTIAGWDRKGILLDDASNDSFGTTSILLPNIASESLMLLGYVRMPAATPAAQRQVFGFGTAGARAVGTINTTPRLEGRSVGSIATGTANPCDNTVHPCVLRVNRTANEVDWFTDVEKVSPAFNAAMSGESLNVGSGQFLSPNVHILYLAAFFTGAAEMTDAQVKTLLQTLGWTVSW